MAVLIRIGSEVACIKVRDPGTEVSRIDESVVVLIGAESLWPIISAGPEAAGECVCPARHSASSFGLSNGTDQSEGTARHRPPTAGDDRLLHDEGLGLHVRSGCTDSESDKFMFHGVILVLTDQGIGVLTEY